MRDYDDSIIETLTYVGEPTTNGITNWLYSNVLTSIFQVR